MAIVVSNSGSYTRVTAGVSGLQYQAQNYDQFIWYLFKYTSQYGWEQVDVYYDPPYDHWGQTGFSHIFTNLLQDTTYMVEFYAKYSGVMYGPYYPPSYTYTLIIPEVTFSNESTHKTNIIFNYTNTVGSMILRVWGTTGWIPIGDSGLPFNKSGDQITISQLIPNSSYYFKVYTYVEDGYSVSPSGSPGYKEYTTQAWPTIPSGVVLGSSGRFSGGLYLTWGDNGYEGDNFFYSLRVNKSGTNYYYEYTGHTNQSYNPGVYGVSYGYSVEVLYSGYGDDGVLTTYGSQVWTTVANIYTAPSKPTDITVGTKTEYTIPVTATGMSGNYSAVLWKWRKAGTSDSFSDYIDYGGSMSYTITGLDVNTSYEIRVYGYYGTASLYSVDYYTENISTLDHQRPSNFAWTSNVSQGASISISGKTIYPITATEWNAFTTKINLFRVYNSLGNYSFTSVSTGNTITKAIINEAISAITDITGRTVNPPAARVTGDIINLSSLYTGLRDSLNSTP